MMARLKDQVARMLHRKSVVAGVSLIGLLAVTVAASNSPQGDVDPRDKEWDLAIDPHQVLGVQSCEKCHANEVNIWKQTPHNTTFLTLHRRAEAQQIAKKLGIESFKSDANCIQCHYTMQESAGQLTAISGVSCESCHGGAKDWLTLHNDYGGANVSKQMETPEHRISRLKSSINAGMRNPLNPYMVSQSCYRCHTVPDEKLVNVGGHSAGSLDFEMVSWSQGTVRHRFLETAGATNGEASIERVRTLFICGMIADLEMSLRSTAQATEKDTFGITSAQRASRAAKRLAAAQSKLNNDQVAGILEIYSSVKLKINNHDQLVEAADKMNRLGLRFGATVKGSELAAIDDYIPPKENWK